MSRISRKSVEELRDLCLAQGNKNYNHAVAYAVRLAQLPDMDFATQKEILTSSSASTAYRQIAVMITALLEGKPISEEQKESPSDTSDDVSNDETSIS